MESGKVDAEAWSGQMLERIKQDQTVNREGQSNYEKVYFIYVLHWTSNGYN